MMDFSKRELNEFVNMDPVKPQIDEAILAARHSKNLHRQLLDVWGEVDVAMALYDKWKKGKATLDDVKSQLECVHKCCYTVYSDTKANKWAIWELKVAEWELYDFILWDNEFHNTRKSVTLWFDEWCYSAV